MSQIIAAAGRWAVVLVALTVTGCASILGPPAPATTQGSGAPDQAADADLAMPHDAAGAVQEAALQSGQPATAGGAAVQLRTEATERGLIITLADLAFAPGRATLGSESTPLLQQVAAFLHQRPTRNALIEGHTDDTGTPTENLHLSLKRAEAVQEVLIGHGVAPRRLILRGYGARYPIAGNDTEAGRRQNRRVEVVVLEQGETTAPPPRELTAGR